MNVNEIICDYIVPKDDNMDPVHTLSPIEVFIPTIAPKSDPGNSGSDQSYSKGAEVATKSL